MLKVFSSVLFCLFALVNFSDIYAQKCDYIEPKFAIREQKNIFLGTDKDYLNRDDSLFIDIYFPVGDDATARPIVIWAFGGGLFAGNRQSMAALCQEMAKRGFVSATIDYRIGFSAGAGVQPPFTFDAAEIVRAGYRGMQDMKAAIRYMKGRNVDDSTDINRVWIGGVSAGGIVSLAAAFIDSDKEKPKEVGTIKPIGNLLREDLGPIEGSRFLNGYNTKVQGVFNFFGAMIDTIYIEPDNKTALFSYHQTLDPIVPCDARTPYWQLTFISSNYPVAYGSCVIEKRMRNLGIPESISKAWIYTGNAHDVHDQAAVTNFMLTNANPILCGQISSNKTVLPSNDSWTIFPNPALNEIKIKSDNSWATAEIFSMEGGLIKKIWRTEDNISVAELEHGMYLLKLTLPSGKSNTKKWLKL